jgi:hypothetical protein
LRVILQIDKISSLRKGLYSLIGILLFVISALAPHSVLAQEESGLEIDSRIRIDGSSLDEVKPLNR